MRRNGPMKAFIADGEGYARARLAAILEHVHGCRVVATTSDGVETIERLSEFTPDILLMDVKLPTIDGLEIARSLKENGSVTPHIVFVTLYRDYAIEALNMNASGYLIKPILQSQLDTVIANIYRTGFMSIQEQESRGCSRICCKEGDTVELIRVKDILFFQAESKETAVYHLGGKSIVKETLNSLEKRVGKTFMRVHRSVLMNTDYVRSLQILKNGSGLLLLHEHQVPIAVSRRHVSPLKRFFYDRHGDPDDD